MPVWQPGEIPLQPPHDHIARSLSHDCRFVATVSDVEEDGRYGVFLVENRRARFVPVTIGITGERHIEITGGVEEGTAIVSGPFQVLREIRSGDRVEVERKGRKSRPEK